ncbi:MAG: beta-galactosidase GalA [Acidobacteriaceae bacterium]|nr:beta-galactosidase GalA [Acidobacteriaceae bacterium]
MQKWTRRDVMKAGLVTSAEVLTAGSLFSQLPSEAPASPTLESAQSLGSDAEADHLRERLLLDFGWRFHLGNICDVDKDFALGKMNKSGTYAKSGVTAPVNTVVFDDSAWTSIDLPHDWAVDLPIVLNPTLVHTGAKPLGREFPETSIAWYRRVFSIDKVDEGKRICIEFDGVFRDATVFVNGFYLARNFSGYAPFTVDITDFLQYGDKNVVSLRVDASLHEGWFYEGAGIYRHVWLTKTAPLHLTQWGTQVQSNVTGDIAELKISTEVANDGKNTRRCNVRSKVTDSSGKTVATAQSLAMDIAAGAKEVFSSSMKMHMPALWSLESPNLYRLTSTVESVGAEVDQDVVTFGIRTIRFDPDKGFFLNDKPVKIKGTCNHQDHAGVGAALPDRLQSYRVELLRQMGSNGCRTTHNPPTQEFMDACDRLGMLVMAETRMFSSSPEGLSELERMIRQNRNHPSLVLWSIANEETEQGTETGRRIGAIMKELVRSLDPTRPITAAMSKQELWGQGLSHVVDVQGFNYGSVAKMDQYHSSHPQQPLIGTETASTVSTRGIYRKESERGYVSAYDTNKPGWGATAEEWWTIYDAREWLSGGFVWTGFDYRGEPTPYDVPCISSHFGLMDTCGFPKDNYFYYKAWWSSEPTLHLFPHWTWPGKEGQEINVWCYCNQKTVELFVNGRSLGAQVVKKNGHLSWKVRYEPGILEAHATGVGGTALVGRHETAGPAAKIILTPDRASILADGEDLSVLHVKLLDRNGLFVPEANNLITFRIDGPGKLIGVGNGDPSCHEPDHASWRSAFNGLCMGIVQSAGDASEITVHAESPGLDAAVQKITAMAAKRRPAVI